MATRKLVVEIEKTLKKVAEGVEVFELIFEKIQVASNQSQKEKFEDQIKTWAALNEIKDKKSLQDSRKLIETQMERFKAMEKELKMKTYSQAGLNAVSKMDPEELRKDELRDWMSEQTDNLEKQIDALETERESLAIGNKKSKKVDTVKAERLEKILYWTGRHRHHQNRLEIVLRMIDNGNLKPDQVDSIKEEVKYYIEENQDESFEENEYIYEDLNLEDAEIFGFGGEDEDSSEHGDEPKSPPKEKTPVEEKIPPKPPLTPRKGTKKEEITKPKVTPLKPRVHVETPALRYSTAVTTSTKIDDELPPLASSKPKLILPVVSKAVDDAVVVTPITPPEPIEAKMPSSLADLVATFELAKERSKRDDRIFVNQMVNLSFLNLPEASDCAQLKTYFPQNPYPVPGYYPQTPLTTFTTTPAVFERLDTDALFFAFYFRPGTYQQFLASKELKRQSWRFHKKYLTWFQRHEEPVEVNENYEQGTYIYFDYEKSWCQRKKNDFRFEYKYLDDAE